MQWCCQAVNASVTSLSPFNRNKVPCVDKEEADVQRKFNDKIKCEQKTTAAYEVQTSVSLLSTLGERMHQPIRSLINSH